MKRACGMNILVCFLLLASTAWAIDYPIVYVRAPRFGDGTQEGDRPTKIPEVSTPTSVEPGTDLVLLNPDGSEAVLVDAGEFGCVLDPAPSLDGQWVFYSLIHDARRGDPDLVDATIDGADIWKINIATGEKIQLTHQEWTPNRGVANWSQDPRKRDAGAPSDQQFLGCGIYNLGACRGCHAHHKPGIEFDGTAASKPDYQIADLTKGTPWTVEFYRDVLPIFAAKCQQCHSAGQEVPLLDATFNTADGGRPKEDKYAFGYSARTSLLYTKMAAGHGEATPAETLKVAQWIDLGCQKNDLRPGFTNNVFVDDHKPTLFLQSPRRKHAGPLTAIRFGAFDVSGLGAQSVKANFPVNGREPGVELSDLFVSADSVFTLPIDPFQGDGEVTVSVKDATGNEQMVVRSFEAKGEAPPDAELERLKAEVAVLKAKIEAAKTNIIDAVKAALE